MDLGYVSFTGYVSFREGISSFRIWRHFGARWSEEDPEWTFTMKGLLEPREIYHPHKILCFFYFPLRLCFAINVFSCNLWTGIVLFMQER